MLNSSVLVQKQYPVSNTPDIISSAMQALHNIHTLDGSITRGMRGITRAFKWADSLLAFSFRCFHATDVGCWRWGFTAKRMCRKRTKRHHFHSVACIGACRFGGESSSFYQCRWFDSCHWFFCFIEKRNTAELLVSVRQLLPDGMRLSQRSHTLGLFCGNNTSPPCRLEHWRPLRFIYKIKEASGKDLLLCN